MSDSTITTTSSLDAIRDSIYGEDFIQEAGFTKRQLAFIYQNGTFRDQQWVADEPLNFETTDSQTVLQHFAKRYVGNPILQGVRKVAGIVDRVENKFSANEFILRLNNCNKANLKVLEITPHNVDQYRDAEIDADIVVVAADIRVATLRTRVLVAKASIEAGYIFVSHYVLAISRVLKTNVLRVPCRGYLITSILDVSDTIDDRTVAVSLVDNDPLKIWAYRQVGNARTRTEDLTDFLDTGYLDFLDKSYLIEFYSCSSYVCSDGTECKFCDTSWSKDFCNVPTSENDTTSSASSSPKSSTTNASHTTSSASSSPKSSTTNASHTTSSPSCTPNPSTANASHKSQEFDKNVSAEQHASQTAAASDAVKEQVKEATVEPKQLEAKSNDSTDATSAEAGYYKIETEKTEDLSIDAEEDELLNALTVGATNRILETLFRALGITPEKSMGKSRKARFLYNLCMNDKSKVTKNAVMSLLAYIKNEQAKAETEQNTPTDTNKS